MARIAQRALCARRQTRTKTRRKTRTRIRALNVTALFQLSVAIEEKGEGVAVRESRKQIALYLHSFRGAAAIRAKINRAETYLEVEEALQIANEENYDG